ncbi:hypothetical protein MBLNU457_g2776t1 [Dothideomycetes sp. NU457]
MNTAVPPAQQEYAGDEVNALVLDPGSNTIRAGFAGEDMPKSVIPSFYGVDTSAGNKLLFGENAIHNPIPNMEIRNPFNADGVVEDWDVASKLFEYSITSRLTGQAQTSASKNGLNDGTNGDEDGDVAMESVEESEKPMAENPLLMSEPAWNPLDARKKAMQVAFEDWGVPAFWLGKTGMLAAFASGKPNALIIDIGANTTSVTPVWDGFVLTKGVQKSNFGSNHLSKRIRHQFSQMNPKVPIVPHYMVKSKTPVDAGAPANATYTHDTLSTRPTDSFRALQEERVLTSYKESMVQVWPGPGKLDDKDPATGRTNLDTVKSQPPRPFEMPDGFNQVFGVERFQVVEPFFDANFDKDSTLPGPDAKKTIPAMVSAALNAVDVEIRPILLSQVVLTGGGSLIEKMAERIQSELSTMFPNPRVRVHTTTTATDRKYGAWIGGSVLASLGTFHQMWVSKKEYEEHGAGIVEKRCR